ncbi:Uncharacterized protein BM_BM13385 [Brugia malayi]|uniref:Bm13385 n=1 Tax=Brugia malayi TaxID=6279 RepID=A0A0K0IXN7_BRUMA|nr:Uncharacterized protein BM_BM13385 [Brugia malayi]CDP92268.1 Bm13385 [Brugia malayi]VIO94450.1 Uncharacterized protein BM_BM13385 [Brugia malayi]
MAKIVFMLTPLRMQSFSKGDYRMRSDRIDVAIRESVVEGKGEEERIRNNIINL